MVTRATSVADALDTIAIEPLLVMFGVILLMSLLGSVVLWWTDPHRRRNR